MKWRIVAGLMALVLLAGCGEKEHTAVRIATKPMTEQFILAEMLGLVIKRYAGLEVEITKGIGGGTGNIHPALVEGKFDLYPEYTGTAWNYVLKHTDKPEPTVMFAQLVQEYSQRFGLHWSGLYGFNNTYSLALREDVAEKHNIRTFSDLARIAPDLILGAEYDFFEREDGFLALGEVYGLRFKKVVDMDIGLKYQALASGKVDVLVVFTTDGKLPDASARVLEDDREMFPTYYCATVVREDALKRFPKLEDALRRMDNILDDATMAALNDEVERKGRNERIVAEEFLKRKGILP